jgi:hypothetical protein
MEQINFSIAYYQQNSFKKYTPNLRTLAFILLLAEILELYVKKTTEKKQI